METIFLFDLDGTITKKELLPQIGKKAGIEDKLEVLTRRTMMGEIPFDQSFIHRVDLLKSIPLNEIQDVVLATPCFDTLLDWIKSNRKVCYVVSGNLDIWINPWLENHGLLGFSSQSRMVHGELQVSKILRKESVLSNFRGSRVVMIGEGANDARIMEMAQVGIATELTHKVAPILWDHADYIIRDEKTLCQLLTQLL